MTIEKLTKLFDHLTMHIAIKVCLISVLLCLNYSAAFGAQPEAEALLDKISKDPSDVITHGQISRFLEMEHKGNALLLLQGLTKHQRDPLFLQMIGASALKSDDVKTVVSTLRFWAEDKVMRGQPTQQIVACLNDPNVPIQIAALGCLDALHEDQALAQIIPLIDHDDMSLSLAALQAVQNIAGHRGRADTDYWYTWLEEEGQAARTLADEIDYLWQEDPEYVTAHIRKLLRHSSYYSLIAELLAPGLELDNTQIAGLVRYALQTMGTPVCHAILKGYPLDVYLFTEFPELRPRSAAVVVPVAVAAPLAAEQNYLLWVLGVLVLGILGLGIAMYRQSHRHVEQIEEISRETRRMIVNARRSDPNNRNKASVKLAGLIRDHRKQTHDLLSKIEMEIDDDELDEADEYGLHDIEEVVREEI